MKKNNWLLVFLAVLLPACSFQLLGGVVKGPTPMPGAGQTPLPSAEVRFSLDVPDSTPNEAEVSLEVVDPVTGVGYHSQRYPMNTTEAGSWEIGLRLPVGSLIRYRYLVTNPNELVEHSLSGQPIRYRIAHITSSMHFEDRVANWNPSPLEASSGRILGKLQSVGSQQPIPEMIVTAGGLQTFSDGQGRFRLEGLPAGLHNLVAYHPEGAFRPVQQGAIVAAGGTTPADFEVEAAEPVTMTFQVTVPADTPTDQAPKLVGNLHSLGNLFASLPGGVETSSALAPTTVRVDDTHYLLLATMYAGTDLRYKYTLGDGLWNAERTANGDFQTRQLIIPETDSIQADQVASWTEGAAPITLELTVPDNTPPGEEIGLQFDPFTPFEPIPMMATSEDRWQFTLWSPLSFGQTLGYQVCRNLECDRAEALNGGNFEIGSAGSMERAVEGWQWWPGPAAQSPVSTAGISPREDMQLGVDLVARHRPSWPAYDQHTLQQLTALGSNSLTVSPRWVATSTDDTPLFMFDPRYDRFQQDWVQFAKTAQAMGLTISVRPELATIEGNLDEWWQRAERTNAWWSTAYEGLRSFLLTQAALAETMGADRFVLNGAQLEPALPGGVLANGQSANSPLTAETYWRALIEELRSEFSGDLIFELELQEDLSRSPGFLEEFDGIQIYWRAPLSQDLDPTDEELQQEIERYLELEVLASVPIDLPLSISAEYLSIENSAASCPRRPSGACRPAAEFDVGADVDPELEVDLEAQAQILDALLLEVSERDRITGFSVRRYYPLAAMQDKSASIHGKPAADIISHWYQRLQGR